MSLAVCDTGEADSHEIMSILWRVCCAAGNNQVNSIKIQRENTVCRRHDPLHRKS